MLILERQVALPGGTREWERHQRWKLRFLLKHQARLAALGYGVCLGFRDKILLYEGAGREMIDFCNDHGIGWMWHPPYNTVFGIGQTGKVTNHLLRVMDAAKDLKDLGMQCLVVHPDAAQDVAAANRPGFYHSLLSAGEYLLFLERQLLALSEVQEACGGLLVLENVHTELYGTIGEGEALRYFLYNALQSGYLELPWIADWLKVGLAFDADHFLGARNFLFRQGHALGIPLPPTFGKPYRWSEDQRELEERSGILLVKGQPPAGTRYLSLQEYLTLLKPQVIHLDGAADLMNAQGEMSGHLGFDLRKSRERQSLLVQVAWVETYGGILEVENDGRLPGYSQDHPLSDRYVKQYLFLQTVRAIERFRSGDQRYQPDPEFAL